MSRTRAREFALKTGWCQGGSRHHHRGVKKRYETIDDAWHDAFVQFARFGRTMTPYRCTAIVRVDSRQTIIPNPNPWGFKAWLAMSRTEERKKRATCGGFHLTTRPQSILPRVCGAA